MPSINLDALTIQPYGEGVFTDHQRGKDFTTLHYRKDKAVRLETALAFVSDVLDDIAEAGLALTRPVKVELSPQKAAFRCHLEVSVKETDDKEASQ